MITYIPITYEATFVRHENNKHVVICDSLPFTVPEGEISMVLKHVDGIKREVANLVTGSVYEYEARPDEPEAQSFYDRTIRERAKAKERDTESRAKAKVDVSISLDSWVPTTTQ